MKKYVEIDNKTNKVKCFTEFDINTFPSNFILVDTFEGITFEHYYNKETNSFQLEIALKAIEHYTEIFKEEQARRITEYDWIHVRELDRKALGKNKHSKFNSICQYREDLRNMDDLTINLDFDVTNPQWPTEPE